MLIHYRECNTFGMCVQIAPLSCMKRKGNALLIQSAVQCRSGRAGNEFFSRHKPVLPDEGEAGVSVEPKCQGGR